MRQFFNGKSKLVIKLYDPNYIKGYIIYIQAYTGGKSCSWWLLLGCDIISIFFCFIHFCIFSSFLQRLCIIWITIILQLRKAPDMSGDCIMADTHFCSLPWDGGGVPNNPGRPDVPEVSLEPLGENGIMGSLPVFLSSPGQKWPPPMQLKSHN